MKCKEHYRDPISIEQSKIFLLNSNSHIILGLVESLSASPKDGVCEKRNMILLNLNEAVLET